MTLRLSSDSCFLNAKGVSDRHSQCWYRHPGAVGGGEAPRRCPFSQEHPLVHVFWYVLFFFFVLFFGLFVSLALWISPWIKKTNRSPMHTFFFCGQGQGQTSMYLPKCRQRQMYFVGGELQEGTEVPIASRPLFRLLWDEPLVVTCKALSGPLSTSPAFLLSSPQAYLRPLRSLVHFRAFVNTTSASPPADSYRLSRLQLRHSFFGGGGGGTASPHQAWGRGSSWRPRSNRVLLQGRASSELNHLSTCLSSLLLPFLGSFSSSLHPHPLPCLSPSPSSLEFILLVQNQSFTDEEWSLLEPCV